MFSLNDSERMELCSLEDAFPDIQNTKKDSPSKEERRAQRKRAKKCKGPALDYLASQDIGPAPDSDLPAIKRLGEIPAFTDYKDAFNDLSGSTVEGFKLPRLPDSKTTFADQGLPGYFGKGLDDEDEVKEGFANLGMNGGESFAYSFEGQGADKAGADDSRLPDPMLDTMWKPLTPAKTKTAFFQMQQGNGRKSADVKAQVMAQGQASAGASAGAGAGANPNQREDSTREQMAKQLRDLEKRLDDITIHKSRDNKKEVLLFVGTGVFLLVCFELMVRAGRR